MNGTVISDDRSTSKSDARIIVLTKSKRASHEAVAERCRQLSDDMSAPIGADMLLGHRCRLGLGHHRRERRRNRLLLTVDAIGSNPRYWLSAGNSQLMSDIGPAFAYFIETFADGGNRDLDFETYWSRFSDAYRDLGISCIDGSGDPQRFMKTGFKAY